MSMEILVHEPTATLEQLRWRVAQLAEALATVQLLARAMADDEDGRFGALFASTSAASVCDDLLSRLHQCVVLSRDLKAVVSRHHQVLVEGDGRRAAWAASLGQLAAGEDDSVASLLTRSSALHDLLRDRVWPKLPRALQSYCGVRSERYFGALHGWLAQTAAGLELARRVRAHDGTPG